MSLTDQILPFVNMTFFFVFLGLFIFGFIKLIRFIIGTGTMKWFTEMIKKSNEQKKLKEMKKLRDKIKKIEEEKINGIQKEK